MLQTRADRDSHPLPLPQKGAAEFRADQPHTASPIRWVFATLLLLASVINYSGRQTLSVLAVTMQRELHLTDIAYGRIVQSFLFAYMVMYVVSGRLVDRFGARWTQAAFLLAWSVADALTGAATGFVSLALSRAALGAAEPGNFTASLRAAGDWFSARERSIAVGMYSMGGTLGAAVAVPLAATLSLRYGWRSTFYLTGAIGAVIALLWLVVYRDAPDRLASAPRVPWSTVLRQRHILPLLFTRMMTDSVWYFFLFWSMKYMQDSRHLSLKQVGTTLWVFYVAADAGSLLGGYVCGRLVERLGVVAARMRVMLPAACCMLLLVCVPFAPGNALAIALLSFLALCHMAWMTNTTTLALDLFPRSMATTVQGMVGAASALGGLLTAALIAHAVQQHGYAPVFFFLAAMHPCAAALLLVRLRTGSGPAQSATTLPLSEAHAA